MAKKVIKIIPTKVGTAYSPTYAYQLLDYIVIDSVTVYICKRVDPNTMTSVGHPLTDTDWWDKGVDLSEAIDKAQMAISKAQVLSDKVTEAEKSRESAEKMRRAAEANRVEAEKKREIDFKQSKTSADDATRKALSTYSHPPYVDADGYYYKWNVTTDSYDKTDVNLTGKAFQIKKVFASVSAMNATDVNTFAENDFILINTANVEDEDNAKLYVVALNEQGRKFYSYLVDMSGFRGFTDKTPQFRGGTMGIEVSYDNGKTWSQVVAYTDIDPDLEALAAAYTKVTQGEADRVKAESTRNSNETARQNAETTRNNNETARKTAETKRQQDTSAAITNSKTQTAIAKELNEHPVKMGNNGNWWQWNIKTHAYEDTGIVARGGAMYPTFKHVGNKLYIVDYGSNVSERVVKKGNKLVFRI